MSRVLFNPFCTFSRCRLMHSLYSVLACTHGTSTVQVPPPNSNTSTPYFRCQYTLCSTYCKCLLLCALISTTAFQKNIHVCSVSKRSFINQTPIQLRKSFFHCFIKKIKKKEGQIYIIAFFLLRCERKRERERD